MEDVKKFWAPGAKKPSYASAEQEIHHMANNFLVVEATWRTKGCLLTARKGNSKQLGKLFLCG